MRELRLMLNAERVMLKALMLCFEQNINSV